MRSATGWPGSAASATIAFRNTSPSACRLTRRAFRNIAPKVSLALAEAGIARDFPRLNALMARYVHPLYALRERMKGYEVAVMKEAMEMLGMPAGPVRPPLSACRARDVEELRKVLVVYRESLEAGAA